jgi:hypothetical protein
MTDPLLSSVMTMELRSGLFVTASKTVWTSFQYCIKSWFFLSPLTLSLHPCMIGCKTSLTWMWALFRQLPPSSEKPEWHLMQFWAENWQEAQMEAQGAVSPEEVPLK